MGKILIADDNAENLYLARFLLEKAGHTVEEAHNGEEAMAAVVKNPAFDLVLMDVQMPVLDGLEATRRIKVGNNAPPIVALTAQAMAGDREAILTAGCDGYIEKPINPETFMANVERYLSSAFSGNQEGLP